MEKVFKYFMELGEEIGLFVVSDGSSEYIIGKKELIELKNDAISTNEINKTMFELVTKCSKTLLVGIA